MKKKGTLRWIFDGAKRQTPLMLLLIVLNSLSAAVSVYFAVAIKNVIDSVLYQKGDSVTAIVVLFAAIVGEMGLRALCQYLDTRLRANLEIGYKSGLLKKILQKDYSCMNFHSGELMNRFTGDAQIVSSSVASLLPSLFSMGTRIVCIFWLLFHYDTVFTAVLCGAGLGMVVITRLLRKKLKALHKRVQETDGKWRSYVQEILGHLPVVWVFGAQPQVSARSDRLQKDNLEAKLKRTKLHIATGSGYSAVFNLAYAYTLIWGVFHLTDSFTYGTLTAMLDLIGQVQGPLLNLSGLVAQAAGLTASAERIMEIEALPERDTSAAVPRQMLEDCDFRFEARGLTFAYDREPVFDHANFEIRKGEFTVVAGASGIGKSTLFKLMMGLVTPQEGTLSLWCGGEETHAGSAWQGLLSYVPQGNLIFSGTVRENIAFAVPEADEESVRRAARLSCAEEFIDVLPDGLDTVIGERGFGLSEGQIQRLAIARAILYDAPVFLLDEATSALDETTERTVLENLKSLGKTVVFISHKPAALAIADRLITVKDRKIAETTLEENRA